jgi:serine/threonine protein kinase
LGRWGPLELIEEVGRGGFGCVYRAWEASLAREVALKVIKQPEPGQAAADAVLHEGRLLARVRHPNVVTVFHTEQIGDEIGLWMEFIRGRSLDDVVKRDGPMGAQEAAVLGVSLCQALAAVHKVNVVHRDVKATNVMREAGGRIVLMDFGAGLVFTEHGAADRRQVGTPLYMAPEVLAGQIASPQSDIYSLGVLLYYVVTGSYPVDAKSWTDFLLAHARAERKLLTDVRPDLPVGFVRVVEHALAAEAKDRYPTAGALSHDLEVSLRRVDPGPGAPRPRPSTARRREMERARTRQRLRKALMAGGGVLVGLWTIGVITSAAFNNTLGRSFAFANESAFDWFTWGLKSIVSTLVYMTFFGLLWFSALSLWTLLTKVSGTFKAWSARLGASRSDLIVKLGLNDANTAATALVVGHVAALVAFLWVFGDLLGAATAFVSRTPHERLALMSPSNIFLHGMYGLVLDIVLLVAGVGWYLVLRLRNRSGTHLGWAATICGPVAIALTILLLTFPYRLFWHADDFDQASYDGLCCYVLGETRDDVLLYCPAMGVPKTRTVSKQDASLRRTLVKANIYAERAADCGATGATR